MAAPSKASLKRIPSLEKQSGSVGSDRVEALNGSPYAGHSARALYLEDNLQSVQCMGNKWVVGRFFKLRDEIDPEWIFSKGSHIRAHQHASRARRGQVRAIGRCLGGSTTKIPIAADANGNPIDFEIAGMKFTMPKQRTR